MSQVPTFLEDQMSERNDPRELGGPNAEPTGVWRILRNGMGLAVLGILGAAMVAAAAWGAA